MTFRAASVPATYRMAGTEYSEQNSWATSKGASCGNALACHKHHQWRLRALPLGPQRNKATPTQRNTNTNTNTITIDTDTNATQKPKKRHPAGGCGHGEQLMKRLPAGGFPRRGTVRYSATVVRSIRRLGTFDSFEAVFLLSSASFAGSWLLRVLCTFRAWTVYRQSTWAPARGSTPATYRACTRARSFPYMYLQNAPLCRAPVHASKYMGGTVSARRCEAATANEQPASNREGGWARWQKPRTCVALGRQPLSLAEGLVAADSRQQAGRGPWHHLSEDRLHPATAAMAASGDQPWVFHASHRLRLAGRGFRATHGSGQRLAASSSPWPQPSLAVSRQHGHPRRPTTASSLDEGSAGRSTHALRERGAGVAASASSIATLNPEAWGRTPGCPLLLRAREAGRNEDADTRQEPISFAPTPQAQTGDGPPWGFAVPFLYLLTLQVQSTYLHYKCTHCASASVRRASQPASQPASQQASHRRHGVDCLAGATMRFLGTSAARRTRTGSEMGRFEVQVRVRPAFRAVGRRSKGWPYAERDTMMQRVHAPMPHDGTLSIRIRAWVCKNLSAYCTVPSTHRCADMMAYGHYAGPLRTHMSKYSTYMYSKCLQYSAPCSRNDTCSEQYPQPAWDMDDRASYCEIRQLELSLLYLKKHTQEQLKPVPQLHGLRMNEGPVLGTSTIARQIAPLIYIHPLILDRPWHDQVDSCASAPLVVASARVSSALRGDGWTLDCWGQDELFQRVQRHSSTHYPQAPPLETSADVRWGWPFRVYLYLLVPLPTGLVQVPVRAGRALGVHLSNACSYWHGVKPSLVCDLRFFLRHVSTASWSNALGAIIAESIAPAPSPVSFFDFEGGASGVHLAAVPGTALRILACTSMHKAYACYSTATQVRTQSSTHVRPSTCFRTHTVLGGGCEYGQTLNIHIPHPPRAAFTYRTCTCGVRSSASATHALVAPTPRIPPAVPRPPLFRPALRSTASPRCPRLVRPGCLCDAVRRRRSIVAVVGEHRHHSIAPFPCAGRMLVDEEIMKHRLSSLATEHGHGTLVVARAGNAVCLYTETKALPRQQALHMCGACSTHRVGVRTVDFAWAVSALSTWAHVYAVHALGSNSAGACSGPVGQLHPPVTGLAPGPAPWRGRLAGQLASNGCDGGRRGCVDGMWSLSIAYWFSSSPTRPARLESEALRPGLSEYGTCGFDHVHDAIKTQAARPLPRLQCRRLPCIRRRPFHSGPPISQCAPSTYTPNGAKRMMQNVPVVEASFFSCLRRAPVGAPGRDETDAAAAARR
ncbi:hypothetical protein RJ55_07262 [Drechmeria coniospora]|nr:hypothetical protein RJ55_07262 [Drechmeria coniospora]